MAQLGSRGVGCSTEAALALSKPGVSAVFSRLWAQFWSPAAEAQSLSKLAFRTGAANLSSSTAGNGMGAIIGVATNDKEKSEVTQRPQRRY